MNKPINMATALRDGTLQTPKMCLEDCLERNIGSRGAFKEGKKLFVVGLDDTDGEYSVSWCQAGMKMSEILSLIEVLKTVVKMEMGY